MFMENFFERKRVDFTAALIRGDREAVGMVLEAVSGRVAVKAMLSEADQKAINQMLAAEKKFGRKTDKNHRTALIRTRSRLKAALSKVVRAQVRNVETVEHDHWLKTVGLSAACYRVMLRNVASCQLTVGCSNFCRRCNEWALAGVRKHFSFAAAQQLIRELFKSGNNSFALYCASDPLDYRFKDKTIVDLLAYMEEQGYKSEFGLLTKIPRGSEALAQKFLEEDADIAVSVTEKNKSKVAGIEQKTGKRFKAHHEVDELLIAAGLDEDFSTVKSSITDNYGVEITPEGASMVIPTFTSALNPTGQCRIPIAAETDWFIKKRVGHDALPVEYFKPFSVQKGNGAEFVLDRLLDPQVENILLDNGGQEPTPPGMMNLEEYFKTYDPEIVRHRKRLAPVAIENLRKNLLETSNRKDRDRRGFDLAFKRKEQSYLDFCDLSKVRVFKKKAFSYLLESVAGYLKTHSAEREIIRFLRREDAAALRKSRSDLDRPTGNSVAALLDDPGIDTFDYFRYLLFILLDNPHDGRVNGFIEDNPSAYDPETGRFV
jgi:hypothetical protein